MEFKKLSEKQEIILYRLCLLQDEQYRQASFKSISELENDPFYREMIDEEYLTYEKLGFGDKAVGRLIVTLKGERYCANDLERISKLEWNSRQQF